MDNPQQQPQQTSQTTTERLTQAASLLKSSSLLASNNPQLSLTALSGLPASPLGSPLHLAVALSPLPILQSILSPYASSDAIGTAINNASNQALAASDKHDHKHNATNDPNKEPEKEQEGILKWINSTDSPNGETPLHIAARLSRSDIVALLLSIPSINDALPSAADKTPLESATAQRTISILADTKQKFAEETLDRIRSFVTIKSFNAIYQFFVVCPRANSYLKRGWIDINAPIDLSSEPSILHFAAKHDNAQLLKWALENGADPNVKDKKGKRPIDLAKDKLKEILKASKPSSVPSIHSTSHASNSFKTINDAPSIKGTLFKWTNYTSGYKPRYFVLEKGTLSYYHSISEYPTICRGSISTIAAQLSIPDSSDPSRFDIAAPGNIKFAIKARSPADAKKWIWFIMESKRLLADIKKQEFTIQPHANPSSSHNVYVPEPNSHPPIQASQSHDSNDNVWDPSEPSQDNQPMHDPLLHRVASALDMLKVRSSETSSYPPLPPFANQPSDQPRSSTDQPRSSSDRRYSFVSTNDQGLPVSNQATSTFNPALYTKSVSNLHLFPPFNPSGTLPEQQNARLSSSIHDAPTPNRISTYDTLDQLHLNPQSNVHTLLHILDTQLDVQHRVITTITDTLIPYIQSQQSQSSTNPHDQLISQLPSLLTDSMTQIRDTVSRIIQTSDTRDAQWMKRLKREIETRKRWEEVLSRVVGIDMHANANMVPMIDVMASRSGMGIGGDTLNASNSMPAAVSLPISLPMDATHNVDDVPNTDFTTPPISSPSLMIDDDNMNGTDIFYDAAETVGNISDTSFVEQAFGFDPLDEHTIQSPAVATKHLGESIMSTSNESKQENVSHNPNTVVATIAASKTTSSNTPFPSQTDLVASSTGYAPYTSLRPTLPLNPNQPKPSLSIWSFLKSAIGKDLSRVTLPVFFNEPVSMLQRMCEDVEYMELVGMAGRVGSGTLYRDDPSSFMKSVTKKLDSTAQQLGWNLRDIESMDPASNDVKWIRILLVAAYAMSNYSSTVGRTSKPFNPMLGETYELVYRTDPITDTKSDSDTKKSGETDHHDTGILYRYLSEQVCHHPPISACYCDGVGFKFWTEVDVKSKFRGQSLELHPMGVCHVSLPVYKLRDDKSGVDVVSEEHYTWKKVTTTVNNLIVGKLSIDHSGDMCITNHSTGDTCVVTFKPKESGGWFGGGSSHSGGGSGSGGSGDGGEVVGHVKDRDGMVRFTLQGRWDDSIVSKPAQQTASQYHPALSKPLVLWKRNPMPKESAQQFRFTLFAMRLNDTNPIMMGTTASQNPYINTGNASPLDTVARRGKYGVIPITDSRRRWDQRCMERGYWTDANEWKERLEVYQRERRKVLTKEYDDLVKHAIGGEVNQHVATGLLPHRMPSVSALAATSSQAELSHGAGPLDIGEAWWTPRWFVRDIDLDTGDPYWRFTGEYWNLRARVNEGDDDDGWPGYGHDIFGIRDPKMKKEEK